MWGAGVTFQQETYSPFENRQSTIAVRIYLTGFMASGKSTAGPLVAKELDLHFIDLDDVIEAEAGQSIPSIFEAQGESAFRRLESEALRATRDGAGVVALGGGALVDADNLAFAKSHGTVVYLRVPVDELVRRLRDTAGERPLLLDDTGTPLSDDDLRAKIDRMLTDRRPYYEQAHLTVNGAQPVRHVVADIVESVGERSGGKEEWGKRGG